MIHGWIAFVTAIVLLSNAAVADQPCRQQSIAGTWLTFWDFGTGNVRCSMRCQLRLDKDGYVQSGGRCRLQMNGDAAEIVHTTGGRIKVTDKRYCDYQGRIKTEAFDFHVEFMLAHNWGEEGAFKNAKKGSTLSGNPIDMRWEGITAVSNGAVGTVSGLWRSPFTNPFAVR